MIARWPRPLFYFTILGAIVVDQLTKAWAMASLRPIESVVIVPGCFRLTYVENTGVAFGMFAGDGIWVALGVLVIGGLALYWTRGLNWLAAEPNLVGGCLCGGALGNLLDRSRFGYVVDFLDFYAGPYHWYVFNVADSLICCAVGWILVRQLRAG